MNRTRGKESFFGWRLLGVALLAMPVTGHAYTNERHGLEVQVIDAQTGQPVRDAAVCLGTSARPDQFGGSRTGHAGIVRFQDLLPNPLVLTVSGSGYRGQQRPIEPVHESRTVVLKLAPGGGGPVCKAAPRVRTAPVAASGVSVREVSVSRDDAGGGENRLLLGVAVTGQANQVRVSERPDFSGSEWQELDGPVYWTLSGDSVSRLYVQVRRKLAAQGASIEEVSPVRTVRLR